MGPKGTFSHEIAETVCDRDEEIIFFPTIREVFSAVTEHSSEYPDLRGIVPVENSGAGGVFETLECLLKEDCTVRAEYYLPIRYVFAVAKGKSADMQTQALAKVYAHPQAHAQCSAFLAGFGNAAVVHTTSNAKSAEETLNDVSELTAAVTTRSAAGIYGLEIIRENIQNYDTNTTRFLEIRKAAPVKPRVSGSSADSGDCCGCDGSDGCGTKCSIVVMPKGNYPGLLYRILSVFAGREINLTRIESRPSGDMMGKYVFFIDYEFGSELDADGNKKLLDWLRTITEIKELGYYPEANLEGQ